MVEFVQRGVQTAIHKYSHINALGATQLTTTIGPLCNVTVNTASGAGGTLTVYDTATAAGALPAAVVAVIDCTNVGSYRFDVVCRSGIRVVTATAVGDYTIAYY